MNMDMNGSADTDYSDFEYQQIVTRNQLDPTGSNPDATVQYEIEPLSGIGGLDNNEVAELVALEVITGLEVDDEIADQDVGTYAEHRGVVGANLPATRSILPGTIRSNDVDGTVVTSSATASSSTRIAGSQSEDRIFQMFRGSLSLPFDDQTNGPGGAGSENSFHSVKSFRDISGRGPVLDASDDMTVLDRVIVGDTVLPVESNVRLNCVWDVAETSDAGRAFSLPK